MRGMRMNLLTWAFVALGLAALSTSLKAQSSLLFGVTNKVWQYYEEGQMPDPAWMNEGYNDTGVGWKTGRASLGFEGNVANWVATSNTVLNRFVPAGGSQVLTYYFRAHFEVSGDPATLVLTSSNLIDDGMIIYLNGVEAGRYNMNANNGTSGEATYGQGAPQANPAGEGVYVQIPLNSTSLRFGDNLLAVEVHQNGTGSSDLVFGMALHSEVSFTPVITQQPPSSITVTQGRSFSLTVVADGAPVPTYQWFHAINGPIAGATAATLTVNNMTINEAGDYYVEVSNSRGTTQSSVTTVNYVDDIYEPRLLTAIADPNNTALLTLQFDESIQGYADEFYYFIDQADGNAGPSVTLGGFQPNATTNAITLTLEAGLDPNIQYTVRIDSAGGITDLFGNVLPDGTLVSVIFPKSFQDGNADGYTGTQDTEVHSNAQADTVLGGNGLNGADLDDAGVAQSLIRFDDVFGPGSTQIPLNATIIQANLRIYTADPTDAGTRIRLVRMTAPWDETTTTWNTLVNGLDTELGNQDATIDGSQDEAYDDVNVTDAVREYLAAVIAGQPFYGWALLAQGGNGWDFATSENGSQAQRPALVVTFDAPITPCGITTHPQGVTVAEGSSFTLSVETTGTGLGFQWYRNNVAIPGANAPTYSVAAASPSQHPGLYHVVAQNSLGACTSDGANVVVNGDLQGDQVVSAVGREDQTTIVVTFSDNMDATTAGNAANYVLNPGGPASAASVSADGTTVTLTAPARTVGQNYSLQVTGVRDNSEAGNLLSPNPAIAALAQRVRVLTFSNVWKYDNTGADNGDAWKEVGYNDSSWLSGAGLFGLETTAGTITALNNQGANTNTAWSRTNLFGTTNITDYVRTAVPWNFNVAGTSWELRHFTDDGIVVYVNGNDVARFNMPTGAVDYLTEALTAAGEGVLRTTNLTGFVCGNNVLAISVHQNDIGSSDVIFGAELIATVPSFNTDCPVSSEVNIVNNGDGTMTISWTGGGTLVESTAVEGPYSTSTNQANPQTVPIPTAGNKFYQTRN